MISIRTDLVLIRGNDPGPTRSTTAIMLRLTKNADYGIVLMTRMARQAERRFTAPVLAEETRLPLPTVSKILKQLVKADLLVSQRGAKGGYALARAPEKTSVVAMIAALDGPIAVTECIEDTPGTCSQEPVCQLRGNWQRINLAVRQALADISLADLTEPLPPLVQLGGMTAGSAGPQPAA